MTTMLGRILGIQEAEMQSLKQYCTPDDFPLLILLEWKKRQVVASRPQLARALLECGFESLAQKLDTTGRKTYIHTWECMLLSIIFAVSRLLTVI